MLRFEDLHFLMGALAMPACSLQRGLLPGSRQVRSHNRSGPVHGLPSGHHDCRNRKFGDRGLR